MIGALHQIRISRRFFPSPLAAVLISLVSTVSLAGTPAADTGHLRPVVLKEIIVTAQKRRESIQEVPAAVSAVTGATLRKENANGLEDYYRQVPSLVAIPGDEGTMQLSIRGVNSSVFTGPTVGIYVDDTPIGSTVAGDHANLLVPDLDPSDLKQVEVLQGPQGTLYGAANMGGLVKFVTAPPSLTGDQGRIELDGSTVNHGGAGYVVRGAFSGPILRRRLAVRVSAFTRKDPGFINDPGSIQDTLTNQMLEQGHRTDVNSARVYGGLATVLWKPSKTLNITLMALYQNRTGDGQTAEAINGLTQRPLYGDLRNISSHFTGRSHIRLQVYNADIHWNLHWATLLSSTSDAVNEDHSVTDITGLVPPAPTSGFPPALPLPTGVFFPNAGAGYFTYPVVPSTYYAPVNQNYRTGKVTQELRLTSPSNRVFEWIAGFFYTHEATNAYQQITLNNPVTGMPYATTGVCAPPTAVTFPAPLPPVSFPPCTAIQVKAPMGTPFHQEPSITGYTEYAEYADLTYHITHDLSIQGGLRYSKYKETFDESYRGVLDFLSTGAFSGIYPSPTDNGSKVTYLGAAKYQFSNDVMAYTRFATGFRPGGANEEAAGAAPKFGPDSTKDYEVGVKTTLAGGRLMLDADGYIIDWQDIQLQTSTPLGFLYFVNGGVARSDGAELDVSIEATRHLVLHADAAYDHAYLTENIPSSASLRGLAGNTLPYSPKWSGTIAADYSFPLPAEWTGHVGADYAYVGSVLDNFYPCATGSGCATPSSLPPARAQLASYSVVNVRASMTQGPWTIGLFVKNVTNKLAFLSEDVQHATFSDIVPNGRYIPDSATVLQPRTIELAVVRRF